MSSTEHSNGRSSPWPVQKVHFPDCLVENSSLHILPKGLALAPWNVVASGKFRTDAEEEERIKTGEKGRTIFGGDWLRNEKEKKVSAALEKIAQDVGAKHITSGKYQYPILSWALIYVVTPFSLPVVAIAYVLQKAPFVFPIIGGRKVEHLLANVEALNITLTAEQITYLESVVPFDAGFPHNMVVSKGFLSGKSPAISSGEFDCIISHVYVEFREMGRFIGPSGKSVVIWIDNHFPQRSNHRHPIHKDLRLSLGLLRQFQRAERPYLSLSPYKPVLVWFSYPKVGTHRLFDTLRPGRHGL